ncbi:hypothetical protein ACIBEJ_47305 [Nonomuraea sp. NPDC050790]|uniref:hypothetical protein n=1 Tax=Nonomuraea sp. NPDC050790 TaxID=3364371 RepID=UPI0037B21254
MITSGLQLSNRFQDAEKYLTRATELAAMPAALGDPQPSGVIGTTTDYAGWALVPRRKNRENLRAFEAEARRSGAEKP